MAVNPVCLGTICSPLTTSSYPDATIHHTRWALTRLGSIGTNGVGDVVASITSPAPPT